MLSICRKLNFRGDIDEMVKGCQVPVSVMVVAVVVVVRVKLAAIAVWGKTSRGIEMRHRPVHESEVKFILEVQEERQFFNFIYPFIASILISIGIR